MPNGSVAVFGAVNNNGCVIGSPGSCDQTETPLLSILSASGIQTAALPSSALGSGNSSITSAAIDANGNFWIVGETDSDDFPLVQAISTQKPAYKLTGFAAKLDPNFNILFATFIGGQPAQLSLFTRQQPNAVAVALDSSGNAYVAGSTYDPNFATTGPVFGVGAPSNAGVEIGYTFLVKISADGSHLLFSRLLGGNQTSPCLQPQCPTSLFGTAPKAIAVDANGNVTIVGATTATNFPITANAYVVGTGAFASRISADGSQLIWSTTLGPPPDPAHPNSILANSVALDAAGNVFVTGLTLFPIATTPGALQPEPPGDGDLIGQVDGNGFAIKLSADGTQLLFATNLATNTLAPAANPGGVGGAPSGVAVDLAGNAWITGYTGNSNFPGLSNVLPSGLDFALELNADATAVQQIFTFLPPTTTQPPAFDSNGNLILLASTGNLVRLNPATALTAPAVFAMTNSAIPQATAEVGPGELVTLYGVGLGPATAITGEPDVNGLYPTQLGGVSVKVNGVAAPLLYVGPNQINFQMLFFNPVVAALQTVVVTTPGGSLPAMGPQVVSNSIGIFVAVNEDFTANSASNPAAIGSIVTLYLTGLGDAGPALPNGAISQSADDRFQNYIEVAEQIGTGAPLGVLYAGTAPELINGVDQVNVQLPPETCSTGNCLFSLGLAVQTLPVLGTTVATSNTVTIYTH